MDIRPKPSTGSGNVSGKQPLKADVITLGFNNATVEVDPARIREICNQFAEIAYSMGETNDLEKYTSDMFEAIVDAYKKVEKKQKKKRSGK